VSPVRPSQEAPRRYPTGQSVSRGNHATPQRGMGLMRMLLGRGTRPERDPISSTVTSCCGKLAPSETVPRTIIMNWPDQEDRG